MPDTPYRHRKDDVICLIVFAVYHETGNIAAQRFLGLLRHLDRGQIRVHVLCSPPLTGQSRVKDEAGSVHHIHGKTHVQGSAADIRAVLKGLFTRPPREIDQGDNAYFLHGAAARGLAIARQARAAGERVVMLGTFDPLDAVLAAYRAARAAKVPLLLDFRDGYAHDNLVPAGRGLLWLRRRIEKRLVRRASALVAVTRPLVVDFQQRYPRKVVHLLPNGYLPELRFDSIPAPVPTDAPLRLGHYGRVTYSDQSSYVTLAGFCAQLQAQPEPLRASFELTFMGHLHPDETEQLTATGVPLRLTETRPAAEAARAMLDMDALLLLTGTRSITATGKLYQYLASGKRIVLVSRVENEASHILREIGDDDVIHILGNTPLDFAALAAKLRHPFRRNQTAIARYAKDVQARDLLAILQSVAR